MTSREAARLIDVSAVRTHNKIEDIEYVVNVAKKFRFINVHTLPCWTKTVSEMLRTESDIYVGAPVGFPGGGHTTEVKLLEAKRLIADGVQEMDMVMNINKFKSKDYDYVLNELNEIIGLVPDKVITKVIIEINCLSEDEVEKACELVMKTDATFIKTGTGWVAGNANIERISKIMDIVKGKIKVKAAGGIRTKEEFEKLCDMGVDRFGINTQSAIEIIESYI